MKTKVDINPVRPIDSNTLNTPDLTVAKHLLNDPSLLEQGYNLIGEFSNGEEIVVEEVDSPGKHELWFRNDGVASFSIRYRGHDYEFVRGVEINA